MILPYEALMGKQKCSKIQHNRCVVHSDGRKFIHNDAKVCSKIQHNRCMVHSDG